MNAQASWMALCGILNALVGASHAEPIKGSTVGKTWPPQYGTVTIRAVPNKTALAPGEELQLDLFAKLDPAIGGATFWHPVSGPAKPATVLALVVSAFDMRITGNTVKEWTAYEKNPEFKFTWLPPIFSSTGLLSVDMTNPKGAYVATDNWLFSEKLVFTDATPGFVTFFDPVHVSLNAVLLSVPGGTEPELKLQSWFAVTTPLVIQVVPAPGTLGLIVAAGVAMGRRRR